MATNRYDRLFPKTADFKDFTGSTSGLKKKQTSDYEVNLRKFSGGIWRSDWIFSVALLRD